MSSKALKRIEKELNEMEKEPPSNQHTAGPKNRNNMYEWEATIIGPSNSPAFRRYIQTKCYFS